MTVGSVISFVPSELQRRGRQRLPRKSLQEGGKQKSQENGEQK